MRKIINCLIKVKVVLRLLLPLISLFTSIMIVANSQPVSDKIEEPSSQPSFFSKNSNNTEKAVTAEDKIVQGIMTIGSLLSNKDRITAGGADADKDASGQPIRNLNVRFKRSHEADTKLSAVTEHKRVTITPHIDGQAVEGVAAETVTFTAARVDFDESSFSSSSCILFTDGQDKVRLAFTAKDRHNQPVRGLVISFNKENRPSGFSTILSDITETNGVYRATLTATTKGSKEIISELANFRLMIEGKPAGVVNGVLLIAPKYYFTVSKDSIAPNYEDESTLTFTAIDGGNQPLHGLAVSFQRDNEEGTILSPITEKNGIYSATLKGFSAKKVTIEPRIGGQAVAGITEKTVTLSWE